MDRIGGDRLSPVPPDSAPPVPFPGITPRVIFLLKAGIGFLLAGVFAWDLMTPLGQMPWLLYAPVLLLTLLLPHRWDALLLAAVCTALIALDFFFSSPKVDPWIAIFNRSVGLATIWGTAVGCFLYKQAQQTLTSVQNRLSYLVKNNPAVVYARDAGKEWVFSYISENVTDVLGYEPAVFLDDVNFWTSRIHPEERAKIVGESEKALLHRGHHSFEYRFLHKDGAYRWLRDEIRLVSQTMEDGTIRQMFIGFCSNITERKRTEEALRTSESRLRAILDNSPNLIFVKDLQGRYLLVNREFEWALAVSHDQILGKTDAEVFPPDQAAAFQANDRKVLDVGHALEFEEEATHKDGMHTSIVYKFPLYDHQGSPYAIGGIATDITERKRVAAALQVSQSDLAEAQRVAKIGSWTLDLMTNQVTWSDELYRIFGLAKSDFAGTYEAFLSRVHPADRHFILETNQKARTGGTPFDIVFRIILPNGEQKTIRGVGHASRDAKGRIVRLFGTAQDISEHARAEAALHAKEALLGTVFEVEPECVKLVGVDGSLLIMNKAGLQMIEADSLEQVAGHCVYPLVAEAHRQPFQELVERVFQGESGMLEFEIVGLKGTRRWLETHATPLRDEAGRITAAVSVTRDVTVRKQSEQALKESEARYRIVMRATNDVILEWNLQTNDLWWSDNFFEQFGYRREALETGAEAWMTRLHPDDRDQVLNDVFLAIQEKRQIWSGEYRLRRADGSYAYIYDRGYIHLDEAGTAVRMTGAFMDITARKQAEELLRNSRDELRALSSHLQSVREQERARIARELHDEFGQVLTGLKIDLSWLGDVLGTLGKSKKVKQLGERTHVMNRLVDESIATIRKLVAELRPAVLDHLDLVAALEWHARDFQQRTRIGCDFRCALTGLDLDQDRKTAVFRIVQEALTNVARHAKATQVTIRMEEAGSLFQLVVEDNGRGITDHEIASPSSFGILGMQERVELLQGQLTLYGRPGVGTIVSVRFPGNPDT